MSILRVLPAAVFFSLLLVAHPALAQGKGAAKPAEKPKPAAAAPAAALRIAFFQLEANGVNRGCSHAQEGLQ